MKKLSMLLAFALLLILTACSDGGKTVEDLEAVVRQEVKLSDGDPSDPGYSGEVSYLGKTEKDGSALLWYSCGNEYQNHYYIALECTVKSGGKYEFVRSYQNIGHLTLPDVAVVRHWKDGYAFVVNSDTVEKLVIESSAGEQTEISVGEDLPLLYYSDDLRRYTFVDREGREWE